MSVVGNTISRGGREHLVKPNRCIIYGLHNGDNVLRYVGRTIHGTYRLSGHRSEARLNTSNMPVHKWMRKYGVENIQMTILEELEGPELLAIREDYWINQLNTWLHLGGFNLAPSTRGGAKGAKVSDSTRLKMSISAKNRLANETIEQSEKRLAILRKNAVGLPGSLNPMAKLDEYTVKQIILGLDFDVPRRELAEIFETAKHNINAISEGKNWKYVREELLNGN